MRPIRFFRAMILGAILPGIFPAPSAAGFTFVSNGRPSCTVIVPGNASFLESRAAEELVSTIERITGARIPVERSGSLTVTGGRVLLGHGSWLSLSLFKEARETLDVVGTQGFVVESSGGGGMESLIIAGGTPRATEYAVMEVLRALGVRWYSPGIERLPRTRTLTFPGENTADFPGFTYRGIPSVTPGWREHLRLDPAGPDETYAPLEIALDDIITPEVISRSPDLLPTIGGSPSPQFGLCCFTHPGTSALVADDITARLDRTPGITHVILTVAHPGLICRCPACGRVIAREGEAGLALSWYNEIAGRIARKHSRVTLVFSDPWTRGALPKTIRPRKNVVVRLSALPVAGSPAGMRGFEAAVNRWTAAFDRVQIVLPFAPAGGAPIPFRELDSLAREIRHARDRNVDGIFLELPADGLLVADSGLRSWVFAEILWDADLNADTLAREWIRGTFGSAASAFFELQAHVRRLDGKSGAGTDPLAGVDDAWLDTAERLMQRAYAMSLSDHAANHEARRMRLGLWYARLSEVCGAARRGRAPDATARTKYLDLLDKFEAEARDFGVERVSAAERTGDFIRRVRAALRRGNTRR